MFKLQCHSTYLNGIFYIGSTLKGGLTYTALHEGQFKQLATSFRAYVTIQQKHAQHFCHVCRSFNNSRNASQVFMKYCGLKLLITILVKIDTEVTLLPSTGSKSQHTTIIALCIHFLTYNNKY